MPLPVPTESTTVSAPVAAPVVAPVTGDKPKRAIASFGAARGDNAIPVPKVAGIDAAAIYTQFLAVLTTAGVDLHAAVEAFKATPKGMFPGNKPGRAAFALGNILANIEKATTEKVKGEKKARVKQADKLKAIVNALKASMGDKFAQALDPQLLKDLGINL